MAIICVPALNMRFQWDQIARQEKSTPVLPFIYCNIFQIPMKTTYEMLDKDWYAIRSIYLWKNFVTTSKKYCLIRIENTLNLWDIIFTSHMENQITSLFYIFLFICTGNTSVATMVNPHIFLIVNELWLKDRYESVIFRCEILRQKT